MSLINYSSREINCKVVYYGPGLGGKTTNIQYVYEKLAPETKGKLVTLATEMDRTLFFDFLPLELGEVKGFKTRFHLYTVPGQVYYNASRKLILRGRGRHRLRGRQQRGPLRCQHRGPVQPARQPEGIRSRAWRRFPSSCSGTSGTCPTPFPWTS